MIALYIPFALQGLAMAVDELYFHRQRGLSLWERIGHPLDTLTVLATYLFMANTDPTQKNLWLAIGLALLSSVFVTKDEFVHTRVCDARENWLHALLFILHPIVFAEAIVLWFFEHGVGPLLAVQSLLVLLFMLYQVAYWSFFGDRQQRYL